MLPQMVERRSSNSPSLTTILIPTNIPQWSSGYENLGGTFTSPIISISYAPNTLDLFGLGTDSAAYHKSYNGAAWSGWDNLGGVFTSNLVASTWGDDEIDVFGRGTDNAMYWNHWNGLRWSGWQSLGGEFFLTFSFSSKFFLLTITTGVFTSEPSTVSWGPGRIDVFVTLSIPLSSPTLPFPIHKLTNTQPGHRHRRRHVS